MFITHFCRTAFRISVQKGIDCIIDNRILLIHQFLFHIWQSISIWLIQFWHIICSISLLKFYIFQVGQLDHLRQQL